MDRSDTILPGNTTGNIRIPQCLAGAAAGFRIHVTEKITVFRVQRLRAGFSEINRRAGITKHFQRSGHLRFKAVKHASSDAFFRKRFINLFPVSPLGGVSFPVGKITVKGSPDRQMLKVFYRPSVIRADDLPFYINRGHAADAADVYSDAVLACRTRNRLPEGIFFLIQAYIPLRTGHPVYCKHCRSIQRILPVKSDSAAESFAFPECRPADTAFHP